MKNIKLLFVFFIFAFMNILSIYTWGSNDRWMALYNATILTIDIMLSPLAVVLIFCCIYGSGFLEEPK